MKWPKRRLVVLPAPLRPSNVHALRLGVPQSSDLPLQPFVAFVVPGPQIFGLLTTHWTEVQFHGWLRCRLRSLRAPWRSVRMSPPHESRARGTVTYWIPKVPATDDRLCSDHQPQCRFSAKRRNQLRDPLDILAAHTGQVRSSTKEPCQTKARKASSHLTTAAFGHNQRQ